MNFTLIVKSHGQKVQRVSTHSYKVFCVHLRSINWQLRPSVYLRVSDGKYIDSHRQHQTFYNDGFYTDKKELKDSLKAFLDL